MMRRRMAPSSSRGVRTVAPMTMVVYCSGEEEGWNKVFGNEGGHGGGGMVCWFSAEVMLAFAQA